MVVTSPERCNLRLFVILHIADCEFYLLLKQVSLIVRVARLSRTYGDKLNLSYLESLHNKDSRNVFSRILSEITGFSPKVLESLIF